mmetsp:Transcript_38602/g.122644  ORF Transcript_38602/g.122644 Transcript_38602/m.122644 type:complete len:478 (+) Transcript_38602:1760-3193(+)
MRVPSAATTVWRSLREKARRLASSCVSVTRVLPHANTIARSSLRSYSSTSMISFADPPSWRRRSSTGLRRMVCRGMNTMGAMRCSLRYRMHSLAVFSSSVMTASMLRPIATVSARLYLRWVTLTSSVMRPCTPVRRRFMFSTASTCCLSRCPSLRSALASLSCPSTSSSLCPRCSRREASRRCVFSCSFLAACSSLSSPCESLRSRARRSLRALASATCPPSASSWLSSSATVSSRELRVSRSLCWARSRASRSCLSLNDALPAFSLSWLYSATVESSICSPLPFFLAVFFCASSNSSSMAETFSRSACSFLMSSSCRACSSFLSTSWLSLCLARFVVRLICSLTVTVPGLFFSSSARFFAAFFSINMASLDSLACCFFFSPTSLSLPICARAISSSCALSLATSPSAVLMRSSEWKSCQRKYCTLSSLSSSTMPMWRSASSFCSFFCRFSAEMPFFFAKLNDVFSSALCLAASRSS